MTTTRPEVEVTTFGWDAVQTGNSDIPTPEWQPQSGDASDAPLPGFEHRQDRPAWDGIDRRRTRPAEYRLLPYIAGKLESLADRVESELTDARMFTLVLVAILCLSPWIGAHVAEYLVFGGAL